MHLRQHKRRYIKKSYAPILSLLTVIFLLVQITFADTEVSGIISTDTTWTLAESPYIVTGDINVEEGVKLTIEPGVTIKFDGNYYLKIGGVLNAIGAEDGIITFTLSSQASIRWNTIKFCDSSVDAIFDENGNYLSGNIIQYSVIEYAGNSGIFIHGASPFINFCRIRNNNTSNSQYNAYNGGGISVVAYDGKDYLASGGSPIIKNCTIINNQSYGTQAGSAIGTIYSSPIITTNIISENIGGDGSITINGDSPKIKNNNIVSDNIAINWQFGYPQIMHNIIKGGIYITYTDQNVEKGKINYNNLDKYNSQYAISNRPKYGGAVDIDASNNWWGTMDTSVIDGLIYDYYDDFEEGKVNYIPILNSPDPDAPISPPRGLTVTYGDQTIDLNWYASQVSDLAGYKVYYDTDIPGPPYDGTGAAEGNSPIDVDNVTSFQLTGSSITYPYHIALTAYDTGSDESLYSNRSPYVDNPSPADGATNQSITTTLNWGGSDPDPGDTVTYDVYFGPNLDPPLVSSDQSEQTYNPETLSYSTTYYWRLVSEDNHESKTCRSVWSFTTLSLPSAPSGLSASAVLSSQINLSWTDNSDNETGFKIERKTGAGGTYSQIDTVGADVITYNNTGLAEGTTYYFRVRAYNDAGNSNYSNEASASISSEKPSKEEGGGGGCFIATATYGSPLHPYVRILRDFMDKYLIPTKLGRLLVEFYYRYSPFVADLIAKHKALKIMVRFSLLPVIVFSYSMLHFGPIITLVMIMVIFVFPIFLISFFRRK